MGGAPYIGGLLRFHQHPAAPRDLPIAFLVDTGTVTTVIPAGAYEKSGIEYADFAAYPDRRVYGVGGSAPGKRVPVMLALVSTDGSAETLTLDVDVLPLVAGVPAPPPLLGRDAIDRFRLTLDRRASIVTLGASVPELPPAN